jgi:signal peptidase I
MIHRLKPSNFRAIFTLADVVSPDVFPMVGHLISMTVTSWSMFPVIRKGDVIDISPVKRSQVGDIVVYRSTGILICHRVTGTGPGDEIYTQGDHADGPDPPIRQGYILGKVTTITRKGQRFSPTDAPKPSRASNIRMQIDEVSAHCTERLRFEVLRCLEGLKQYSWIRRWAASVLRKHARFYIATRAPVQVIEGYRNLTPEGFQLDEAFPSALSRGCRTSAELMIVARLGQYPLGSFAPASDELQIRRLVRGLGLEACFREVYRKLQLPTCAS